MKNVSANAVNLSVKPAPAKPYGCHNKPRPVAGAVTHIAQDGWLQSHSGHYTGIQRKAVWVPIHHVMSTDCRYVSDKPDPRCAGCQHINQGSV